MKRANLPAWGLTVFVTVAMGIPVAVLVSRAAGAEGLALMRTAWERESFRAGLFNSFLLAGLCGALALVLGGVGAALRTHVRVPARFVDLLAFLPLVLPPFVGAVGVKRMLVEFGPVNLFLLDHQWVQEPILWVEHFGLYGVALLQALHLFPLVYFQVSGALSRQDPSLFEAAALHGLSPGATLWRIRLPLLVPGLVSSFLFVAIFSLTDLGTPLLFDVRNVLAVEIYTMAKNGVTDPLGYLYALVLLGAVVVLSAGLRRGAGRRDVAVEADRATHRAGGPWRWLAWGWFLGVGALSLLPHATVVLTALADHWIATVAPERYNLDAFSALLTTNLPRQALIGGFLLSFASAVFIAALGLVAALTHGAMGGRTARWLGAVWDLPLVVPGILVAYGWLAAYTGTWLDPFHVPVIALLCTYTVRRLPLAFRSLQAGLDAFSKAPFEAAGVHGLPPLTALFRVTLPLLWPYVLSSFMIGFAFTYFEVSDSLLLATSDRVVPMAKAMYQLANFPEEGARLSSALGVVGMGVMAVAYLLMSAVGGGFGAAFGAGAAPAEKPLK